MKLTRPLIEKFPAVVAHLVLSAFLLSFSPAWGAETLPIDQIELPPGFAIDLFASNVPNARSMTLSPKGTLFVGTRKGGQVYAVLDQNRDNRADEVIPIAQGLN
ncbi:MAG: sorbosone dehydrogenase family protein, partial [Deltaproteobacteria bacterium]|nr:sorbosone dehydrogenase family protein [Deltaproteobacteria bacterium]